MFKVGLIIASVVGCIAQPIQAVELVSKGQRCPECGRYYEKYHVCGGR